MLKKILSFGRYPEFLCLIWWRKVVPLYLRRTGVELGLDVRFQGSPIVSMATDSQIVIGDRANLCSASKYTALGVNHKTILRTMRSGASLSIGADTGLSGATICAAVSVSIGRECLIGANVVICDTDFHAVQPLGRRYNNNPEAIGARPIAIGNNVFIGANSIVLKGVKIGDNSVIGAGSVVVGEIPADCVAAGNPAIVLRRL